MSSSFSKHYLTMEEEILEPCASSSTPKTSVGANDSDDDIAVVENEIYNTTIDVVHKNINIDDELFNYFLSRFRFSPFDEELIRGYLTENYSVPPNKIQGLNLYKYVLEEHPAVPEEEEEESLYTSLNMYKCNAVPEEEEEVSLYTSLGLNMYICNAVPEEEEEEKEEEEEAEEEENEEEEEEEEWCEPIISYTGCRRPRRNLDA